MKITERPSLRTLNTFGVAAKAALRIDIESEEDVLGLPSFNAASDLLLGGGSNILLVSDVPGSVFLNRIRGRQVVETASDTVVIEVGAGENWHDLVGWTLARGYSGLENLALIPGNVGAAPIQNIGAYGVELASRVESVTAWDLQNQTWHVFSAEDCQFGYRDSLFKSTESDRFLITSLRLLLDRKFTPHISYQGLEEELGNISDRALAAVDVFEAVVRIRTRKLPNPEKIGNAGSFFKNPVVSTTMAESIIQSHPDVPHWPAAHQQVKLSAAWMIEQCGLKGFNQGPAGVSDQHALVLVNRGGASGKQLWQLAGHVRGVVQETFGIDLEPEPRILNMTL